MTSPAASSTALSAPGRPARRSAPRRLVVAGVAAAGIALGLVVAGVLLTGGVAPAAGLTVAVALPVGWSYLAVGLYAWHRRPDNPFGRLLTAVAFAWFAAGLAGAGSPAVHTAGLAISGLYYAVLVHLLLAFPTGRVRGRAERAALAVAYVTATVGQLLVLAVADPPGPGNLLLARRDPALAGALEDAVALLGAAVTVLVAVVLAGRWRSATARQRRALAPVLTAGTALAALLAARLALAAIAPASVPAAGLAVAVAVALGVLPYAFLAGLARTRFFTATAVTDLLTRLTGTPRAPGAVHAALAEALGDPDLTVAYWLPDRDSYVDAAGLPVRLPLAGRAATEVELDGRRVAALVHDPALAADPDLVRAAGAAAVLGLDNERLAAELRARVAELEDSRRRLLDAAEAERRRLERDLHDGAQQRLVALRVTLSLAGAAADRDPAATRQLIDAARDELDAALAELRDLARGLHPAVLAARGLPAALASLTARAPVPVELTVDLGHGLPDAPVVSAGEGRSEDEPTSPGDERLGPAVESAVYFVVGEALTNIAKHSGATKAQVHVTRHRSTTGDRLRIHVRDDGTGDADPAGSGLRGLAARVAAHDGVLTVNSPPSGGTELHAQIPLPAHQEPTGSRPDWRARR